MRDVLKYSIVFISGGIIYTIIEILFRGFSHWTMTILGGVCFAMLYYLSDNAGDIPLIFRCVIGAMFITSMEFAVGYLVNIRLGWNVWDYSSLKFNLFGQISLLFTTLWFLLCFPGFGLCTIFRNVLKFIDK